MTTLGERLDVRVEQMLKHGLLKEVRELYRLEKKQHTNFSHLQMKGTEEQLAVQSCVQLSRLNTMSMKCIHFEDGKTEFGR
jgi:tRNA A37 N6-isopentenylltransferase MiaA